MLTKFDCNLINTYLVIYSSLLFRWYLFFFLIYGIHQIVYVWVLRYDLILSLMIILDICLIASRITPRIFVLCIHIVLVHYVFVALIED